MGIKKNYGLAIKMWLCCIHRQHADNQVSLDIIRYSSLKKMVEMFIKTDSLAADEIKDYRATCECRQILDKCIMKL